MIKNIGKIVSAMSILLLTHLPFCQAAATDAKAVPKELNSLNPFHRTLKVRVGPVGLSSRFHNLKNDPNFKRSFDYTVDNDIEYGRVFGKKKKWYWSAALSWNIFYSGPQETAAGEQKTTLSFLSKIHSGPITHLLLGYTINPKHQVLLGLTYLWGITAEYRYCLTKRLYLSTKVTSWHDRRFVSDDTGIHDMYSTIGIGYITL
ncbi:MAG: hypothetical protein K2X94_03085 [Amoebophilaceae bacterium]|nr:hypothetical protein [Amoebophilaceae bacterium]